jgi:hypothetical protein
MAVRYRGIIAGLVLGCVSLLLTFHLNGLFTLGSNVLMRTLKAAGFAIVVPGLIAAIVAGNVHTFRLPVMAAVNFVFWFGFGWLFATFIAKLIELRRAISAVGVPSDRSSSLGSGAVGAPGDRPSSLGPG